MFLAKQALVDRKIEHRFCCCRSERTLSERAILIHLYGLAWLVFLARCIVVADHNAMRPDHNAMRDLINKLIMQTRTRQLSFKL